MRPEWQAVALNVALVSLGVVIGIGVGQQMYEPDYGTLPDYRGLGTDSDCAPSDEFPCWRVDMAGCLYYANATQTVRHCGGREGT